MKFRWAVSYTEYRQGSSDPYREDYAEGELEAEGNGEALHILATRDPDFPWDLIESDREMSVSVEPLREDDDEGKIESE